MLALAVVAFGAPADSLEFRELLRVPYLVPERVTTGDADHDGRPELYGVRLQPVRDCILEFQPDLSYETTGIISSGILRNWFARDLDCDGKTDLCLQCDTVGGSGRLRLYESVDSVSLPLRLVWQTPVPRQVGSYTVAADLDADSANEVVCSYGTHGPIYVYECAGDDSYELRGTMPETLGGRYCRLDVWPDIDRDGLPELVTSLQDSLCAIVFEAVAPGVDSYRVASVLPVPLTSGIGYAYAGPGGPDIDGDGRAEGLLAASDYNGAGLLAVYESPANDSFELVWRGDFPSSYFADHCVAVGNVDGDSVPDIAVTDGQYVRVYRCTGPNRYEQFGQVYTRCAEVGLYDLNCDGKDEVIAALAGEQTGIYEWLPVGIEEQVRRGLERVIGGPSVVRRGAIVRLAAGGLSQAEVAAAAEAVDVAGRSVASFTDCRTGAEWRTGSVWPGAYFIRVSSAGQTVTRKLLILP